MGESNRKQAAAAAQSQLLQVLNGLSEGPRVPGIEPVQVLIFRLDCVEQVREKLGQLPGLVEVLLQGVSELPKHAAVPQAILWEHWPGGRQVGRLLAKFAEAQMLYCKETYLNAGVRGREVRIAAFPAEGWSDAMHEVCELHVRNLAQILQLMAVAPPLRQEQLQGRLVIRVPKFEDDGARAGLVGHVLQTLDSMVASQASLQKYAGRLHLAFEGYDDDPREVWDIPQPKEFMRRLNHHAPWWPLLISPEQAYVWLAPQLAQAPSKISPVDGLVGFPAKEDQVLALLQRLTMDCLETISFAGFDPAGPEMSGMVERSMLVLSQGMRWAEDRYADIEAGRNSRS